MTQIEDITEDLMRELIARENIQGWIKEMNDINISNWEQEKERAHNILKSFMEEIADNINLSDEPAWPPKNLPRPHINYGARLYRNGINLFPSGEKSGTEVEHIISFFISRLKQANGYLGKKMILPASRILILLDLTGDIPILGRVNNTPGIKHSWCFDWHTWSQPSPRDGVLLPIHKAN